jgi:hypothetical protein
LAVGPISISRPLAGVAYETSKATTMPFDVESRAVDDPAADAREISLSILDRK